MARFDFGMDFLRFRLEDDQATPLESVLGLHVMICED